MVTELAYKHLGKKFFKFQNGLFDWGRFEYWVVSIEMFLLLHNSWLFTDNH
jgi:hypothetical protein